MPGFLASKALIKAASYSSEVLNSESLVKLGKFQYLMVTVSSARTSAGTAVTTVFNKIPQDKAAAKTFDNFMMVPPFVIFD